MTHMTLAQSAYEFSIVDVFAAGPFMGNPAAVLALREFPSDQLLSNIAAELHVPMTAFVVPMSESDPSAHRLRWFTPDTGEIPACGHATLATAHVLGGQREYVGVQSFTFHTLSGVVTAARHDDGCFELDFPADDLVNVDNVDERVAIENSVLAAIGGKGRVRSLHRGHFPVDTIVELSMSHGVFLGDVGIDVKPLAPLTKGGIVLTTQLTPSVGEGPLFHSRVLFPHMTLTEDPASGSPHSSLAMLYSGRFGGPGTKLLATQGGRRRGQIIVEWDGVSGKDGGRCKLRGPTVTVVEGRIRI